MSTDLLTHVSAEEYLRRDRAAWNAKLEWFDGEIREVTGGTLAHSTIVTRITFLLTRQTLDRPFELSPGQIKVRIPDRSYCYPDVVVFPDPPAFEDGHEDIILDPLVVIEVLSPSTERFDRGRKLDDYRSVPTVRDYLLVDQSECRVDHYQRADDGWDMWVETDPTATVDIPSIGCGLPLAEVYGRLTAEGEG